MQSEEYFRHFLLELTNAERKEGNWKIVYKKEDTLGMKRNMHFMRGEKLRNFMKLAAFRVY